MQNSHKKLVKVGYRWAWKPEYNFGVTDQWHYSMSPAPIDIAHREMFTIDPLYAWVEVECPDNCPHHKVFLEGDIIDSWDDSPITDGGS